MDEKLYEQIEKLFAKWWGKSGNKYMGDPFMKLRSAFYNGYHAGAAAQSAACKLKVNQVNKLWMEYDVDDPHGYIDDIFKGITAALVAAEIKEEK
jgi:hypothetical protein